MHALGKYIAAGLAAASFLLAPLANAQDLSDKKLDAVAAAVKQVSTVSDTYTKKLAQAPDSEKEKILDQADEAVTKAVTDQGLSVDEYMSIMKVAENDPSVRGKLIERLK